MFSDFVELSSVAFSNVVDRTQHEEGEARYHTIRRSSPATEFEQFPILLALLTQAMEQQGFGDVLGPIYAHLQMADARRGQFFTPYEISRCMASLVLGSPPVEAKAEALREACPVVQIVQVNDGFIPLSQQPMSHCSSIRPNCRSVRAWASRCTRMMLRTSGS